MISREMTIKKINFDRKKNESHRQDLRSFLKSIIYNRHNHEVKEL